MKAMAERIRLAVCLVEEITIEAVDLNG